MNTVISSFHLLPYNSHVPKIYVFECRVHPNFMLDDLRLLVNKIIDQASFPMPETIRMCVFIMVYANVPRLRQFSRPCSLVQFWPIKDVIQVKEVYNLVS